MSADTGLKFAVAGPIKETTITKSGFAWECTLCYARDSKPIERNAIKSQYRHLWFVHQVRRKDLLPIVPPLPPKPKKAKTTP